MKTIGSRNIELLQSASLNWPRIMTAIARGTPQGLDPDQLFGVCTTLKQLVEITGYWSISRKALTNIGLVLARSNPTHGIRMICPVCINRSMVTNPDLSQGSDSTKLPPIIEQHIAFLERVHTVVPIRSMTFLFAMYSKTQTEEDRSIVRAVLAQTRKGLSGMLDTCDSQGVSYSAEEMAEYMPNIRATEERLKAEIADSPEYFRALIKALTPERREYCIRRSINTRFIGRAINKSIAEFMVLGRYAASNGTLICTHTTGRIRCFIKAGAGVLHNPVSLH